MQMHTLGTSRDNGRNRVPLEGPPTCGTKCQLLFTAMIPLLTKITALVEAWVLWFSRIGILSMTVCKEMWRLESQELKRPERSWSSQKTPRRRFRWGSWQHFTPFGLTTIYVIMWVLNRFVLMHTRRYLQHIYPLRRVIFFLTISDYPSSCGVMGPDNCNDVYGRLTGPPIHNSLIG